MMQNELERAFFVFKIKRVLSSGSCPGHIWFIFEDTFVLQIKLVCNTFASVKFIPCLVLIKGELNDILKLIPTNHNNSYFNIF